MPHITAQPDVVKRGDSPTLYYRANADLSTATSITFYASVSPDVPPAITRPATFIEVDADGNSEISVELTTTDTATTGTFVCEVEALITGKKHTFPSEGFLRLKIVDDLG